MEQGAVYALCMTLCIFTALPCKHNGQAALNSTMAVAARIHQK